MSHGSWTFLLPEQGVGKLADFGDGDQVIVIVIIKIKIIKIVIIARWCKWGGEDVIVSSKLPSPPLLLLAGGQ